VLAFETLVLLRENAPERYVVQTPSKNYWMGNIITVQNSTIARRLNCKNSRRATAAVATIDLARRYIAEQTSATCGTAARRKLVSTLGRAFRAWASAGSDLLH
jgi:hypothetical protein